MPCSPSSAPYPHASTSLRLRCGSKAVELQSSVPPRLYSCSAALELHNLILPCLHASGGLEVQNPMPPSLHVVTPITSLPELHTSIPQRLHTFSTAPDLQISTSLRLQHASRAPGHHTSTSLHLQCRNLRALCLDIASRAGRLQTAILDVATPTSNIWTFIHPYLPVATPVSRL